jgi:hypothetical protein
MEDYAFPQHGSLIGGSALIASSTRTDNELERLISEKLNQRYNYKKKAVKVEDGVKIRGAAESLSVNGVINSTQVEEAMGLATYSALKDSGSHSLVNQ